MSISSMAGVRQPVASDNRTSRDEIMHAYSISREPEAMRDCHA